MSRTIHNTIADLRAQVAALHTELTRNNLVVWTAGNVSARVPGEDLMVIKPSGVSYDDLTADAMVVCDLDGNPVEGRVDGDRQPSSDAAAHAYVYRHMPEVGGAVHTHSTYATAWAARGEAIPCVLTMIADEFGGEIPVGPFALIGDDSIGRGIVETLRGSRSKAVLMRNHGPFTIGKDARSAVKAAVMVEDVARTVHIARQLGEPVAIDQADVDSLYDRYQNVYGQRDSLDGAAMTTRTPRRSGSSPAASTSTAPRSSTRSPPTPPTSCAPWTTSAEVPVRGRRQAGAHRDRRDPPRPASTPSRTTPASA